MPPTARLQAHEKRTGVHLRYGVRCLAVLALALGPHESLAQEQQTHPPLGAAVIKKVFLDPTTYAPAAISYDATMRDWNTSQVFFEHGYREWNERFTVSGLQNDVPISYAAGRRRILLDTLVTLQLSAINNLATGTIEEVLVRRFPKRRRLLKTLAVIDRVALASYMSYRLAGKHYQQARYNTELARSLGFR